MKIAAKVQNKLNEHHVEVQTNDVAKVIQIPSKSTGYGSSINGGELLFLALATCYCNDLYREAAKRNMNITNVEVEVFGEFLTEGEAGSNIHYKVKIEGDYSAEALNDLIKHTDTVVEIQNTLRKGVNVELIMD